MTQKLLNDFANAIQDGSGLVDPNASEIPKCVDCGCFTANKVELNPNYHAESVPLCEDCAEERLDRTGYTADGDFADDADEYDHQDGADDGAFGDYGDTWELTW